MADLSRHRPKSDAAKIFIFSGQIVIVYLLCVPGTAWHVCASFHMLHIEHH